MHAFAVQILISSRIFYLELLNPSIFCLLILVGFCKSFKNDRYCEFWFLCHYFQWVLSISFGLEVIHYINFLSVYYLSRPLNEYKVSFDKPKIPSWSRAPCSNVRPWTPFVYPLRVKIKPTSPNSVGLCFNKISSCVFLRTPSSDPCQHHDGSTLVVEELGNCKNWSWLQHQIKVISFT